MQVANDLIGFMQKKRLSTYGLVLMNTLAINVLSTWQPCKTGQA